MAPSPGGAGEAASPGGLDSAAAAALLKSIGPNELASHQRTSALRQLLSSFVNPLLGILLVAAAASAILGERVNAAIVVMMVVLSGVVDFVQSSRSARAVERLRAQVAPRACALRDARWLELPGGSWFKAIASVWPPGTWFRPTHGW